MESKKINQLATELAPDLSDLTIIGDPTTGISKKITLSQMASLFTGTVEEYATLAAFPLVGVADTIYIALDTNIIYRYDTSLNAYVILSPNIINSLVFSDANGFDGTITLVGSVATLSITTALTLGSVPFIGASGALIQDNSNLFFDDTNNRLGIATALPTTPLDVFGSGIIGRLNATSTNNAFLGFASAGTNQWSIGNVQSDQRFRIYSEANTAELVSVLQTGEFGIGIANPTTKLHIDGGATALIANLDANVSVAKSLSFRSDNSNRINFEVSGTESGSNAGANFFLRSYTDAGSLLDTPFEVTRATGASTIRVRRTSSTSISAITLEDNVTGVQTSNVYKAITAKSGSGASISEIRFLENGGTNNDTGIGFYTQASAGNLKVAGFFDKNGNFGINTTDPKSSANYRFISIVGASAGQGGVVELKTSDSSAIFERSIDSNGGYLNVSTNHPMFFFTNNVERMRITSVGNVGIGVTASAWSGVKALQIGDYSAIFDNSSYTILSSNVYYNAGNKYINAAKASQIYLNAGNIVFEVNNTTGTAGNTISFTEAMRISSAGNVGIGTSTPTDFGATNTSLSINGRGGNAGLLDLQYNGTSGMVVYSDISGTTNYESRNLYMRFGTNNAERMRILSGGEICMGRTTGSGGRLTVDGNVYLHNISAGAGTSTLKYNHTSTGLVTYDTSSRLLKKDIENLEYGIEDILKMSAKRYKWKKDDSIDLGFIADEMFEIIPEIVFFSNENTEQSTGVPSGQPLSINYDRLIPILVKGIQELKAQIDELKNK